MVFMLEACYGYNVSSGLWLLCLKPVMVIMLGACYGFML